MRKIIRSLILTILILWLSGWALIHSSYIKQRLAEKASHTIFQKTGTPIKIGEISLEWPSKIHAHNIIIGEAEQPQIIADQATFIFSPLELLQSDWSLIFTKFSIQNLSFPTLKLDQLELPDNTHLPRIDVEGTLNYNPSNLFLSGSLVTSFNETAKSIDLETAVSKLKIHSHFTLQADQTFHLALINDNEQPVALNGEIHFSPTLDLTGTSFQLNCSNLSFLKQWLNLPIDGHLNLEVILKGNLNSPSGTLFLMSHEINYDNITLNRLTSTLKYNDGIAEGHIAFTSPLSNSELEGSTNLQWSLSQPLNLTDIALNAPGTSINGHLSISPNDSSIEGQLKGISDLSIFKQLLPLKTHGTLSGTVNLYRFPSPLIQVDFDTPKIIVENTLVSNMQLSAKINNPFINPIASLKLSAEKIISGENTIEKVNAETSIDPKADYWPFAFSFTGTPFSVDTLGVWIVRQNSLFFNINSFNGEIAEIPFSLYEATALKADLTTFTLSPFNLKIGQGNLMGFINYSPDAIQSELQLKNLPIALCHLNSRTFPLSGILAGNATISGHPQSPSAHLLLSAEKLVIEEKAFAKIPPAKSDFEINMNDIGTACSGNITLPEHPPMNFSFHVPLFFSASPASLFLDRQAPLEGHLTASGEIEPLLQLFLTDTTTFTGNAQTKLSLSGSVEKPQINGACDIINGTFESQRIGTVLKNFNAHIEAEGTNLILKNMNASDIYGGSVTGTGYALLDADKNFPFNIEMLINKAQLLNQDYAQASFDGQLTIHGDADAGFLLGKLDVNEATISIPDQTPALMNTVDVTYINLSEHELPPQSLGNTSSWPLHLDLHLNIPSNLTITGKDLSSEWKGALAITGNTQAPLINGEIKVSKGVYLFNGKPFEMNQGTITLAGEMEKKTSLYLIASKDLDKVKVDVILKGPIKNPAISFRSNPPLPQREILSWLLFNRGTSEISSFQGSQLTESITNLDSNHKGPDVLTKIRTALGIDRLEICQDPNSDTNEMGLKVGKYISDNVFISVNKSDVNKLAIEAALTEKIKLQAEIGDDSEGQLLLKWKRDY